MDFLQALFAPRQTDPVQAHNNQPYTPPTSMVIPFNPNAGEGRIDTDQGLAELIAILQGKTQEQGEIRTKAANVKPKSQSPLPRPGALGIAALVDLLAGGKGRLLGNFVGGFGQGAEYQNQQSAQEAERQQAILNAQLQNSQANQKTAVDVFGLKQDQEQIEYRKGRDAKADERQKEVDQDVQNNRLLTRYNSANSIGEKQAVAPLLIKAGLMTPDELQADLQAFQAENVKAALVDWNNAQRGLNLNAFGEIRDEDAKAMEPTRQAIAKAYGLKPEDLPPIRTGKTVAKEREEAKRQEWQQAFEFRVKQGDRQWQATTQRLAISEANLDLAAERLEIMRSQLAVSQQNSATSAMNAQYNAMYKQWQMQGKSYNQDIQKQIDKLTQEAVKLSKGNLMKMDKTGKDFERLQQINAEIAFLERKKAPVSNEPVSQAPQKKGGRTSSGSSWSYGG